MAWTQQGSLKGPQGAPGDDGAPGRGVTSGVVNAAGELVLTYSDAAVETVGVVRGADGTSVTIAGSAATPAALPTGLGPEDAGTGYIVESDGDLWVWDGAAWDDAGQIQGPVGPQGPQGIQGIKGDQGVKGDQGIQGIQGVQGPQGIQGARGLTWRGTWSAAAAYAVDDAVTTAGATYRRKVAGTTAGNPAGDAANWELLAEKGATGAQGDQGIQGIQGVKGDTGAQGIQGVKGDKGDTGAQGIQGVTGATGARGLTWRGAWASTTAYAVDDAVTYGGATYRRKVAGTTGTVPSGDAANWEVLASKGDQGIQGVQGVKGDQGIKGDTGAQGDQGIQGVQGVQGDKGDQGIQGPQGVTGVRGSQWFTGNGAPGTIAGALPGDKYLDLVSGVVYDLS